MKFHNLLAHRRNSVAVASESEIQRSEFDSSYGDSEFLFSLTLVTRKKTSFSMKLLLFFIKSRLICTIVQHEYSQNRTLLSRVITQFSFVCINEKDRPHEMMK